MSYKVGSLNLYFYDVYNKKEITEAVEFAVWLDVEPTNVGERLIQNYQIRFSESKIEGYTPLYISQGGIGYPIIEHGENGYYFGKETQFYDRSIDDDAIVFCIPSDVAVENYDCEHDITDVRIAVADSVKELRTLNFENNDNKYIYRGDSFDTDFFSVEIDNGTMAESYFTYGSTKSPICSIKMTKNLLVQSGKYIRIEFCVEGIMWQDFGVFYVEDNPEWTSEDTTVNGIGLLQFAETLNPPRTENIIDGENIKLFDFFKEFNDDGKYVYSEYFEFVSNLYSDNNTLINKKYLVTPYIIEPYEYEENTFSITIEDAVKECVRGVDFEKVRKGIIDIYNAGESEKTYKVQCEELSQKTGYAYDWVWFMFETSVNYTKKGEEFNSFAPSYIEMSLREYISHLAVCLHCNVSERNGVLHFDYVDKNSYSVLEGEKPFGTDCYTEEPTKKIDSYISPYPVTVTTSKVSQMAAYKSNGDVWFQFYGKLDDTTDIALFEDDDVPYSKYPLTIVSEPSYFNVKSYDKTVTPTSYIRDAMDSANANKAFYYYPINDIEFVGWNPLLYSGGFVKIDFDGIVRNVYIGNSTLYWDGGASVQISTPCDVSLTGNSTSYSTGGDGASSSAGSAVTSSVASALMDGTLFRNGSIEGSVFKDGTIENSKIKDSTITGSKIDFSTFENGVISGSAIDTSTFKDGQISGTIIDTSTFKDGTIKGSVIESSTLKDIPFASMDKAFVNDLTANSIFTDSVKAAVIDVGALTADEADLKYATITSLEAVDGKITTLSSKAITTDNLSANVAKLGYLSADSAELAYAKVDFSNVGSQVVKSSMIVDGAVTNEKVGNLSANKITSGTIDASKIVVTNLNADNLTVGTINGKLIGKGSVDLNKLSEEVPTKEYLDSVQENLQGQIDGAIETFTKTEIPTLNNEPASLWTDNATKKKHVGDICYVVNPTSSADGYCYRFANLGTEANPDYSWVLIKDSDVTKALQDIININGEITGIKKFDTEISSWKTDTDSELSSLKKRTSTLETDMGTKVETSTFNELKQTVSENSSNITSLSTTVSKKADSSTVSELSNTVNSVKQTADSNTSSISSLQTTVSKKADSSTVTELSSRTSTLEQDLTGFKTTVSNTYATKTEFNDLEIGGRNLLQNSNFARGTDKWASINANYKVVADDTYEQALSFYTVSPGSDSYRIYHATDDFAHSAGTTYALSFYAKASKATTLQSNVAAGYNPKNYSLTSKWKRYTNVYSAGNSGSLTFWPIEVNVTIYIANVKLEKGNKATDWTPAPEDTDNAIEASKTEAVQESKSYIDQTADGINLEVEKKVGTNEIISKINQSAESVTISASKVNLSGYVTLAGLKGSGTTEINGANIVTGTISADKLDVTDLFAQDITATNMLLTESSKIGSMSIAMYSDGHSYLRDGNFTLGHDGINIPGLLQIINPDGLAYIITSNSGGLRISSDSSLDSFIVITEEQVSSWVDGKVKWRLDDDGLGVHEWLYNKGGIAAIALNDDKTDIIGSFTIDRDGYNAWGIAASGLDLVIKAPTIKLFNEYGEHINLSKNAIQATERYEGEDAPRVLYLNNEGGNVSIDNLTSQDKIGVHSHIKFDNNICIYGTNSSGGLRSNFQPVNSNNNCVIGYGSWSADEGSTNIYGKNINLRASGGMSINPYGNIVSNRILTQLWSGAYFMNANQSISLSENVSDQLNGIVLVWSYYSSGTQNYNWNHIFVPKAFVASWKGNGTAIFLAGTYPGYKYVYINDSGITGNDINGNATVNIQGMTTRPANYVLRYVYGV